ncbi:hypothetical protein BC332_17856 [Capsicum chinense]|nr:hypothetical protein BC332_17856 [Capsicum chinense]
MARSIYFMALLVLGIILLVANGMQGSSICKTKSKTFNYRPCKRGVDDSTCRKACVEKENFEDGRCEGIRRYCWCSKPCVFDNIPNDAGTILVQDAKIFEAELLEKELMMV